MRVNFPFFSADVVDKRVASIENKVEQIDKSIQPLVEPPMNDQQEEESDDEINRFTRKPVLSLSAPIGRRVNDIEEQISRMTRSFNDKTVEQEQRMVNHLGSLGLNGYSVGSKYQ